MSFFLYFRPRCFLTTPRGICKMLELATKIPNDLSDDYVRCGGVGRALWGDRCGIPTVEKCLVQSEKIGMSTAMCPTPWRPKDPLVFEIKMACIRGSGNSDCIDSDPVQVVISMDQNAAEYMNNELAKAVEKLPEYPVVPQVAPTPWANELAKAVEKLPKLPYPVVPQVAPTPWAFVAKACLLAFTGCSAIKGLSLLREGEYRQGIKWSVISAASLVAASYI